MKIKLVLVILLLTWVSGFSQTETKAEKSALKCIDNTLSIAGKDINYIITSSALFQNLISNMDTVRYELKSKEVDSILTKCGLFKSNHLNVNLLINCMQRSYDIKDKKNDTSSAYFQLLGHLIYLSNNPSILIETTPTLHLEAINSIITTKNNDKGFYDAISFILFKGIMKEFESFAKNQVDSDKISLTDTKTDDKKDIQAITIIYDAVQIEEIDFGDEDVEIVPEITTDQTYNSLSARYCDELFLIVEKMPEFKGGENALKNYLLVNSSDTQGKVYVQFEIDCDGKIINPKILKGISPIVDKNAIDLVKSMPIWTPGEQKGFKVKVQVTYPVIFE